MKLILSRCLRTVGYAVLTMLATLGVYAAQPSAMAPADAVSQRLIDQLPTRALGQAAVQLADGRWLFTGGEHRPREVLLEDAASGVRTMTTATMAQGRKGHTATLLPNGTVLIFGGQSNTGAVLDTAEIYDPATDTLRTLGAVGLLPRSQHSATVLVDGRVLVAGGIGADGSPLMDAEWFNANTLRGNGGQFPLDRARVGQLATLLPNRSVLLWGRGEGRPPSPEQGDLVVPTGKTTRVSKVSEAEAELLTRPLASADAPVVVSSAPANGEDGVPVDAALTVRFNKWMSPHSLSATTVTLLGPSGPVAIMPVALERGVVLFVTPARDLLPASRYTLFIQGAVDLQGQSLPFTALGFRTQSLNSTPSDDAVSTGRGESRRAAPLVQANPFGTGAWELGPVVDAPPRAAAISDLLRNSVEAYGLTTDEGRQYNGPLDDTELWLPGRQNWHGDWISQRRHLAKNHRPVNPQVDQAINGDDEVAAAAAQVTPRTAGVAAFRNLRNRVTAKIARGTTAVAGQVLRLNGRPLANVTLSIGTLRTSTNGNGEFILRGVPAGHQVLIIDGGASNHRQRPEYGRYEYGLDVVERQTNVLPFPIWLSRLDSARALDISSPTKSLTILTNPRIPGLELRIPAGTVIRDSKGKIVTRLSLTAIPVDQPPFPLPDLPVPTYFTVQPGGAHLENGDGGPSQGAQLVYPNFTNSAPGTRMTFWDYDATARGWYAYGQGTVTADGTQVMPDRGVVVYRFTGAMVSSPSNAPAAAPTSGDGKQRCGDPVDCATGLFLNEATDISIPDVMPIVIRRSYRPKDPVSRAFGIGTNLSYDIFTIGDTWPYTYQDLILPDGGRIHFVRTSPGTSFVDAVYQNTDTPGIYFGAVIRYWGGEWQLTRKDGMVYIFGDREGSTNPRAAALLSVKDRMGNALTLARAANGNLTQITSPNGRRVSMSYDASNRITEASDDVGRLTQYAYDVQGRLVTVTDPAGTTESFTYDSSHNMLTVQNRRGHTMVTNVYDANGRVTKQTYADGSTMLFAYTLDTAGTKVVRTTITDQRGTVSRTDFNGGGYPVSITAALGLPQQQITTLTRDPSTNLLSSRNDALNRTSSFQYDALGNLTRVTRPDGSTVAMTYTPAHSQLASVTDANNLTSTIDYDNLGNPTRTADALGHATTIAYDMQGRPERLTDALGNATSLSYFGADLSGMTDPLNRRTTRLTDSVGRVTAILDAQFNKTVITYDARDRVTAQTDANGNTIQFSYDGNDNVLTHKDAKSNATGYTYDSLDRVLTQTDALGKVESWSYDAGGNVLTHTDRKNQVTRYSYDALSRLTGITFNERDEQYAVSPGTVPGSTLPPPIGPTYGTRTVNDGTITNTWDAGNRLTQTVDSANGTITRTYDALDRLTQETSSQGAVAYTYDAQGRRSTMTAGNQPAVSYTFDNANRLIQIRQAAGSLNGNTPQTVAFGYDDANRRTSLTLPNGITASTSYNAASQLTSIVYRRANSAVLGDLSYTYDEIGRRASVGGSLAPTTLPAATSLTANYDANNRLTAWNGVTQTYDFNGNLLNDGTRSLTWNSRDQLTAISGSATADFQYDAFGRRRQKAVSGTNTSYLYDGDNFVQRTTGSTTYDLLTGGVDEVFAQYVAGSTTTPLTDALGSNIAEADTSQTLISATAYDPYGVTTRSGTDTQNRQLYTGREDDGTGLYYYRARYYSPATARFIGEDPIGWNSGQANNYSYVGGDPISLVDPMGLEGVGPWNNGQMRPTGPVAIPTFLLFSLSGFGYATSGAADIFGNVYGSPPGMGVAKPSITPSASLSIGLITPDLCEKKSLEDQTKDIVGGLSYTASVGAAGGSIGFMYSPSVNSGAMLIGIGTPGRSFSGGYSFTGP